MPNDTKWKKVVTQELTYRLGGNMLLLLEDRRKEKGFRKDVTRWILIARDTALPDVVRSVKSLLAERKNLADVLNLKVFAYSQAMEWAVTAWPEWLQILRDCGEPIAGESEVMGMLRDVARDESSYDVTHLIGQMESREKALSARIEALVTELMQAFYQCYLTSVQKDYLTSYPETKKTALYALGSPSPLLSALKISDQSDLQKRAKLVQQLLKDQQNRAVRGDALLSAFRQWGNGESTGKTEDEDS